MGENLTPADAALLSRVLGHAIEPGLVRTLGPSTLAAIIQAARSEGPHPKRGEVERLRTCLRNIQIEYERDGSKPHHLKRVVAIQCRAGLSAALPPLKGEALPVAVTDEMVEAGEPFGWLMIGEGVEDFMTSKDTAQTAARLYGFTITPLYARPSPGVSREEVAHAIAYGFSNGNEQYAMATEHQRDRYDMAADAVRALLSRGEG